MYKKIDFVEVFKDYDKEIPIIIHNNPDPDAMSAAWGLSIYLKHKNLKCKGIYYAGEISHPMNKAMVTLLDINLIDYIEEPFELGLKAILVDTNNIGPGTNQPSIPIANVEIVAVIDHHKGKNPDNAVIDRRQVGAAASIVWDYLKEIGYDFVNDEGCLLATAIVTGVFTDTENLMSDNLTDLDFKTYESLIRSADKQKLASIMNYPLPQYLFELRQQAFLEENKKTSESIIVSGVGIISSAKRDALPVIADEFIRMPGITTSVVFAIIEDHIIISARSKNVTLDVGDFLNTCFGTGGGKPGAGGARVPLGFFSSNGNNDLDNEVWELAKKMVFNKVFGNSKKE